MNPNPVTNETSDFTRLIYNYFSLSCTHISTLFEDTFTILNHILSSCLPLSIPQPQPVHHHHSHFPLHTLQASPLYSSQSLNSLDQSSSPLLVLVLLAMQWKCDQMTAEVLLESIPGFGWDDQNKKATLYMMG